MILTLILLPLAAGLLTYPMGHRAARWFAVLICFLELGLVGTAANSGVLSFYLPWVTSLGIAVDLKLTGQNIFLLGLSPLLAGCALLATCSRTERLGEFCGHVLLLLAALQGVFLANNLGLFYICYELMLLPTLLLVSRWGSRSSADPQLRSGRSAAVKFLLYTLAGSLPMLLAVVAVPALVGTPDLSFDALRSLSPETQQVLFGLFFLAFAVKIPLFPLHGWVVDLYETCPPTVTAVVAGAMSKAGLYGLLRIGVGLFPQAASYHAERLTWLALVCMVYGAVCALGAPRIRAILAYSSTSHLALMTMGIMALNPAGREGALLLMLSHGLCVGGLFLVLAFLDSRGVSGDLAQMGGLQRIYPRLTAIALVFTMASLGCPGLSSFPGDLCVLLGLFQVSAGLCVLACFSVVMSAWYMLRFFQGIWHGPGAITTSMGPPSPRGWGNEDDSSPDLGTQESLALVPLVLAVFWLGFAPQSFLHLMRALPWN